MRAKHRFFHSAGALAAAFLFTTPAHAALTLFQGSDANVTSGAAPRPNSAAAAAAFDAAAGATTLVDFEGLPVDTHHLGFDSLSPTAGLTIDGETEAAYIPGAGHRIRDIPYCNFALCGGNTTAGGENFLEIRTGFVTFDFSAPVSAFGAYFSGAQLENLLLTFDNGDEQTITLDYDFAWGALNFIGFTDTSGLISSIRFESPNDFTAVDDLRFSFAGSSNPPTGAVPEPATWAMMIAGFALIGGTMRRRSRRPAPAVLRHS